MSVNYYAQIAEELKIGFRQVQNTVELLENGASIPFIARYRKELTNSLDEVIITNIRDRLMYLKEMDKRREAIISSITEQGFMTPSLLKQLNQSVSLTELEDIYLPFKPKKKTRATIAIAKGLEPFAKILMSQGIFDIYKKAEEFIKPDLGVSTIEEALSGARDIIAEWVNENVQSRNKIRYLISKEGIITSKVAKNKEKEAAKFSNYFECKELLMKAPSHRVLAMFRGENEGMLKISVEPPAEKAIDLLDGIFVKSFTQSSEQVKIAIRDSYKRLLLPSLENEIRNTAKEKADKEAIAVFRDNLKQLLLAPPLGQKNILAIDPGFRSGCKLVCLDKQGKLLHNETIYPHPPEMQIKQSLNKIESLVDAYKIEAIAIGNGTAGRETEEFIKKVLFKKEILVVMVNESGASVYSASAVAREEFPDYDITVRGAVSIGRRLMDPLAELVKIDPKSIGVGQYQHDVDQKLLQQALTDTVISSVNAVGVEMNTASKQLLTHVSGLGPVLAQNIIDYRNEHGPFKSRAEIKKVPRFGEKAFEQAAGFLRIRDAKNPLDASAVHPERYNVVDAMARNLNCDVIELIKRDDLKKQINIKDYVSETVGIPTLTDIMQELAKPGRDPRMKFDFFEFSNQVNRIEDLQTGMVLPGIVTNITAFGAFVDLGVHQDGMVHVSQMANQFVKDPAKIVKLNQKVVVKVLDVDLARKRIQLSMKDIE